MVNQIKILTYNIAANYPGYGDYVRMDKLREVLLEGDWDLICLNEVYNKSLRNILLHDKRIEQKYPYIISNIEEYPDLPLHNFDNGLALLSKHIITKHSRYEYKAKLDGFIYKIFSPKDLLYAEINFHGTPIDVFVTHLQWGDNKEQTQTRFRHFHELANKIEEYRTAGKPALLCGDLNIYGYPDHRSDYQEFTVLFDSFTDWHHMLHPADPAITWSPSNARVFKWFSGERFDYIFATSHFIPMKSQIKRYNSRTGPYIMKWQPTPNISYAERLRIELKRLLRVPLIPLMLIFTTFMTIYRLIHGYPQTLFLLNKDLSDHYALEGIAELHE